jgi:hypothetical protein
MSSSSSAFARAASASDAWICALRLSTSPIKALAAASSFLAFAWPISFEASLRRLWAPCNVVWAARRRSSN